MEFLFQTIALTLLVMQVSSMMPQRGRGPASFGPSFPSTFPSLSVYASNDSRVSVYKPESEMCCSGNVFPSTPNSYHQCCGSAQFDTTRQKCCDGVVHDLRPGFDCCGSIYFSIKEAKCCISPLDGKAFLKQFPESILGDVDAIHSTLCCGLKLYNSKTHICCLKDQERIGYGYGKPKFTIQKTFNYMPQPYVGLERFTPNFIIFQKKFKTTACCNGRIYDRSQESCVNIQEQPQTYQSLGQSTRFVSIGFPVPPIKDKCNAEEYNSKTHICCSHFSNENGTFDVVNKLEARKWPNTLCCGLQIYDYETQICCNSSKIHQQNEDGSLECCGAEVFDVKKEQCCGVSNAIVTTESLTGNDSCCGHEKFPYNSKIQICCGNKVLELPEVDSSAGRNYQCCWAEDSNSLPSLYNVRNESCCDGVKHEKKNVELDSCCGSQSFNWNDQLCCDEELFNKTSKNDACCGKKIYDFMTHLCCDVEAGVVVAKKSRYDSCCGTIVYDYNKEVCCSSNSYSSRGFPKPNKMLMEPTETAVFPRATGSTSCCGLNVIDLETHQCCGTTPIESSKELCCHYTEGVYNYKSVAVPKITSHARCCGKDAYDPNTERCCNDTVVQTEDKNLPCCGSFVYDPEKQLCCDGNVHTLDEGNKIFQCCGENLVNPTSQVCCRGAIKDKGEAAPPTACCYPPEDF